jgi:hypothetical protein
VSKQEKSMSDIASGNGPLKCAWEVRAGVVPSIPMPEYTRRWFLTSEIWNRENEMSDEEFKANHPDGKNTYATFRDDAYEYAKGLNDSSRYLNWVEISWIWY